MTVVGSDFRLGEGRALVARTANWEMSPVSSEVREVQATCFDGL